MNNILFYYASPDVVDLFEDAESHQKGTGRRALYSGDVICFIYKRCDNQGDSLHYDRDSVYMSKYSKKNHIDIIGRDLRAEDLKKFINSGCVKFDEVKSKNESALKLFDVMFPKYFRYRRANTSISVPETMLQTGIFISKSEWSKLKSSGKVPTPLKRLI